MAHMSNPPSGPANQAEADERRARYALEQARVQGDRRREAGALSQLGFCLLRLGRISEAEATLTQSLTMARADGDRLREAGNLASLSGCAKARSDLDTAGARLRESLAVTLALAPADVLIPEDDVSRFTPYLPERKARKLLKQLNKYAEATVLHEIADSYEALGYFLVDEYGNGYEGRRMFAEAEAHYREEAHYYEQAARALGLLARLRPNSFEKSAYRQALRQAKDMHALQLQLGAD
jgi:tetratricopeptide (TPR) repeat protein